MDPVISPSILASIKEEIADDWLAPKEFLLGLGEPWEPFPFDPHYDDEGDKTDSLFVSALQAHEETSESVCCKPQPAGTDCSKRWGSPKSSSAVQSVRKSGVPEKIQNQTKWAVGVWREWASYRRLNTIEDEEQLHPLEEDFATMQTEDMNFWLCKFVIEARKKDQQPYPPDTLYSLCCGLFRALKTDRADVKPFENPEFAAFTSTLDAKMKMLKSTGEYQHKQAAVISEEMEDVLWKKDVLGDTTPQQLLDTLIFYIGLYFALRSGQEHRRLRHYPSQLKLVESQGRVAYLRYQEDVSKTNQGGLKQRKKVPKEVIQNENTQHSRKCLVRLYKLYNSKCPQDRPNGAFYLKPLQRITGECWFSKVALSHNTLANTVKRLCEAAGIEGYYTNHSLRRTAATRLFRAGVDEHLIILRTGHSTSSGVRAYKTVTEQLKEVTSNVLNGMPVKKPKLEDADIPDLVCPDNMQISKRAADNPNSPLVPANPPPLANPPLLPVPTMNFGGATNFTVNFNYGK